MSTTDDPRNILGHTNLLLRKVDPARAEELIRRLSDVLLQPTDGIKVAMPDAVAALCATFASIVLQAPRAQRGTLCGVIARLIAENLAGGELAEACMRAAEGVAPVDGEAPPVETVH